MYVTHSQLGNKKKHSKGIINVFWGYYAINLGLSIRNSKHFKETKFATIDIFRKIFFSF